MEQGQRSQSDLELEELLELYDAHFHELSRYALRFMQNSADAEDMVQNTFVIAYKKRKELFESPNRIGWLYRTIQNVMRNQRREQFHTQRLLTKLWEHQDVAETSRTNALGDTFGGMVSLADLELLIQHYVEGYPQKQIAKDLGISLSACKMRIFRAKELLRTNYTAALNQSAAQETCSASVTFHPLPDINKQKEVKK